MSNVSPLDVTPSRGPTPRGRQLSSFRAPSVRSIARTCANRRRVPTTRDTNSLPEVRHRQLLLLLLSSSSDAETAAAERRRRRREAAAAAASGAGNLTQKSDRAVCFTAVTNIGARWSSGARQVVEGNTDSIDLIRRPRRISCGRASPTSPTRCSRRTAPRRRRLFLIIISSASTTVRMLSRRNPRRPPRPPIFPDASASIPLPVRGRRIFRVTRYESTLEPPPSPPPPPVGG